MNARIPLTIAMVSSIVVGASGVRAGIPAAGAPQAGAATHDHAQPAAPAMAGMMEMHERMMAEMKAADTRIDALTKQMNSATGSARVDAIAAVVNELVGQQKAMHARMGEMHQQTMMNMMPQR